MLNSFARSLRRARRHRVPRAAACLVAVLILWTVGSPAAGAQDAPTMTVTGEPTQAETAIIERVWGQMNAFFAPQRSCIEPIEVKVVDRVEDWYSGVSFGPIAAFYRDADPAVVFVEHGKVRTGTLIHEFGHHLDFSCGVDASPLGAAIREAQGLASDSPWTSGGSWSSVPAEVFAEAVTSVFGQRTSIGISDPIRLAVWSLARTPVGEAPAGISLGSANSSDLARVCFTSTGVLAAL